QVTERPNPADDMPDADLSDVQRDHVARLMRINHTGEVCAQALYQGQALTARDPVVRTSMERSAAEENDHLDWCEQRVEELGGRLSLLNPFWYAGSFAIGALAGVAGDKWSLGFVAETERQVEGHLDEHLEQVPAEDQRTRAILEQMKRDEIEHGQKALDHGGARLPAPIKALMKVTAKIMTTSVYRF
ncbi:MAG: 2-polyprenyl-3-methyl-6-methoxy-1,4-benzoquinone monooxygenase, partial [Gammaproteobacteria bacterium]|nr:2-polyprenyl-3-methyl-6-methoxy-1,4-benzoquinone monooxygenase [Gammaproteobacteria bacterium]